MLKICKNVAPLFFLPLKEDFTENKIYGEAVQFLPILTHSHTRHLSKSSD